MITEIPLSIDKHGVNRDLDKKALVPTVSFNTEFYGRRDIQFVETLYFFTPATTAIWLYNAPFQISVLVRFSSVWFSLVTVLLIVCPLSLLLCPFHKKLRIWWKKSFGFCQTDNPRSSFMMYCYSTDLNVYTWVELTYQNRQVFWIQSLT